MSGEATVSAPGKTILFGEHAAVYGHAALVTALDHRMTVRARTSAELPSRALRLDIPALGILRTIPTLNGAVAVKEPGDLAILAVAIAAAGISVLAAGAAAQLWISLSLCATFALYGLLRKIVAADAMSGLAVETALLFPFAIAWLAWRTAAGAPSFGSSHFEAGLLVLAGIVSTTPLLLFTAAARKLAYSTLGMLQFLAPTLQFLIGVYYGEPFTTAHAIAFPAIWIALALYVTALLRAPRLPQAPE